MAMTIALPAKGGHLAWTAFGAVLAVSMLVLAGSAVSTVQAQGDAIEPIRSISVAATGRSEVAPDMARVRLGVNARGETAQRASRRAAMAMDAVVESLRESGIEDADIKTTRLSLNQVRQRDSDSGRRVAVGWQVQNRVNATVRDIDAVGDVIDSAIRAGASNVDNVRLQATDPSVALAEARLAAVTEAESAAAQLAEAAGVEVIGVLSIAEGNQYGGPYPASDGAFFRAESARAFSTPVLPGLIDVAITVYIEYQIS